MGLNILEKQEGADIGLQLLRSELLPTLKVH